MAEYRSRSASLGIRLKNSVRSVVNGKEYFQPGIRVQFKNGLYSTENKEIIETLDEMLSGPRSGRWTKMFTKVPSKEDMKKIQEAAQAGLKAQKEAMSKNIVGKDKNEEIERFKKFVERAKISQSSADMVVRGLRGT